MQTSSSSHHNPHTTRLVYRRLTSIPTTPFPPSPTPTPAPKPPSPIVDSGRFPLSHQRITVALSKSPTVAQPPANQRVIQLSPSATATPAARKMPTMVLKLADEAGPALYASPTPPTPPITPRTSQRTSTPPQYTLPPNFILPDTATGAHGAEDPVFSDTWTPPTPPPTRAAWGNTGSDGSTLLRCSIRRQATVPAAAPAHDAESGADAGERRRVSRIAARWRIDEAAAAELALNFELAQGGGADPRAVAAHLAPVPRHKKRMPWNRGRTC